MSRTAIALSTTAALSTVVAGCANEPDAVADHAAASAPTVTPVDSILLDETDRFYLGNPFSLVVEVDGTFVISDFFENRMLKYERDGRLRAAVVHLVRRTRFPDWLRIPSMSRTAIALSTTAALSTVVAGCANERLPAGIRPTVTPVDSDETDRFYLGNPSVWWWTRSMASISDFAGFERDGRLRQFYGLRATVRGSSLHLDRVHSERFSPGRCRRPPQSPPIVLQT